MTTQAQDYNVRHKAESRRRAALGKIHIGKKLLAMDDDTYRAMLLTIGGVKSSKDLTPEGIDQVVRHLEKCGAKFSVAPKHGRKPNNMGSKSDRAAKLSKIEALLAEAGRPWEYAHGLAKKMYKKSALEFCDHTQLSGVITALVKDAERHGWRTA